MKITQIVQKELVSTQNSSGCMHCQHTFNSFLSIFPLLHSNSKQAMKVTIATIFFLCVINLLKNGSLELNIVSSVIFELVVGELIADIVKQIVKPVYGNELEMW